MIGKHFLDDLISAIQKDATLSEDAKASVFRNFAKLKDAKVNILITGATGCGKSSTINALFNTDKAKVGQGVDPETMEIAKYEFDNIVLFDSPGLGDTEEADKRHAKQIVAKLHETNPIGEPLIDLVLVILDGGSRDLGTSFELINKIIIPNLGEDKSRLLVAINQADMAMKGKNWNREQNRPDPVLTQFLNEKVASTQRRIREATGVDVEPIYYAAGYKDGDEAQNPFNLSKLLLQILLRTREEKRAVFAQDLNADAEMWKDDDKQDDYRGKIEKNLLESLLVSASKGADFGGKIGSSIGRAVGGERGQAAGEAVGKVLGAIGGAIGGLFSIFS